MNKPTEKQIEAGWSAAQNKGMRDERTGKERFVDGLTAALEVEAGTDHRDLVNQIEALLDLDARKALTPHGVGGLARELLTRCISALTTSPASKGQATARANAASTAQPALPVIDPALIGIAEEMEDSGGHWMPCSGCYDTEDGHPTRKYAHSRALQTDIGCGCHECGGLGAVWWHMTDDELAQFEKDCADTAPPATEEKAASVEPQPDALNDFRKFVDLIEGRAMACDGPVTPFLEELSAASDGERKRFTEILRALYASPAPQTEGK